MKRIFSILFLLLIVVLPLQVEALSVSKNDLTINKGEEQLVDLYAEVDTEVTEVNFSLVYTSYDVPAYFNIESGLRDEAVGIKHKIVFSVPVTGKIKLGTVRVKAVDNPKVTSGAVNIHSASATNSNGETISLNAQMLNVTINKNTDTTVPDVQQTPATEPEEDKKEITDKDDDKNANNLLSKIESQIVNIELKKDVFEYSVKIKEDVEELDLKPILADEKYTVEISNQKISELEDNKIIIKVSDGAKTEEYKITVDVVLDVAPEIDDEEFESSFAYKGKWILLIIIFGVVLGVGLLLTKKQYK